MEEKKKRIAILGGGPSGMFVYKRLAESGRNDFEVTVFERNNQLGAGMPYSHDGANREHVTNVSDNEIPEIVTSIEEWIHTAPKKFLEPFDIEPENFNEYKVLPRLLFGSYLSAQFGLLIENAKKAGITTHVHLNSQVTDIIDEPKSGRVVIHVEGNKPETFDNIIICTGHNWPLKHEGKIPGYFDSPYPPSKLELTTDHPVAIKGASLTAIDAIRTLSRHNGTFETDKNGKVIFHLSPDSRNFRIVMHSRNGMLPAIRFHLDDSHLTNDSVLTQDEISNARTENDGFLSLDFIFDRNFKELFRKKDPAFYERIKDWPMEQFVDSMMELRDRLEPFQLFKAEYAEAERSIKNHQSIYWKEMLAVLSFAMNYPAKYLSAEDMQRLQKVLMPLIAMVIAFVPQSSAKELLALYEAGILDLVSVGEDSAAEPESDGGATYSYADEHNDSKSVYYKTFINCVGQPHLAYEDFPFKSLRENKTVSPARIKFRFPEKAVAAIAAGNKDVVIENGNYYLKVPGISINDQFRVLDPLGAYNERIYIMAVPYIGGYNPDYSGLDFCEEASQRIVDSLFDKIN